MTTRWSVRALAIVAVGLLVMCSSPSEDGESCEEDGDCSSGRCVQGSCEGSDCTCEGSACRTRSSCREGWLCTRGEAISEDVLARCRRECSGAGTCPSGNRCSNGICRSGAEPFALTWVNIPRSVRCGARVPCEYKARVAEGVAVETYTWLFGSAPPIETKEPTTKFTYEVGGVYEVLLRAKSTSGAIAELRTTEILCTGGIGDACEPSGAPCCEGSCSVANLCK